MPEVLDVIVNIDPVLGTRVEQYGASGLLEPDRCVRSSLVQSVVQARKGEVTL